MLKSLLKDSSIYALAECIFRALNYLTLPLFALCFSIEEFGQLSLALVGIQLCTVLFDLGGITAGVGRLFWEHENTPLLLSTGLYTSLGIGLLGTVSVFLIEKFFHLTLFPFTFLIIFSGLLSALHTYALQLFRLKFSPWSFTLHSLFLNILTLILRLYAVYILQEGIQGYLTATLIGLTIALTPLLYSIRLTPLFNWPLALSLLRFAYPLLFITLAHWCCCSIDRLMLAEFSTPTELGYYSIGFKLMTILQLAVIAFNQAFHPHITRFFDTQREHFSLFFKNIMSLWLFFLTFAGGAIALFSTELLLFAFPSSYLAAQSCCVILSIAMIFWGGAQMTSLPIAMHKKNSLHTLAAYLIVGINGALNYLLIPSYGALGAAYATALSYLFLALLYFYLSNRIEPLSLEYSKLLFCFCGLSVLMGTALFLQTLEWSPLHLLIKISLLSSYLWAGCKVNGLWQLVSKEPQMIR